MDGKELYESLGAVCDALPVERREEFVSLVDNLTRGLDLSGLRRLTAQRWLRDAGWKP